MTDQAIDRTKLPIRRPPFSGVANQTLDGSQPDWGLIGHPALANAIKASVAQIDGLSAKNLKAELAEARAGMGG
jgi:hypothetical protein